MTLDAEADEGAVAFDRLDRMLVAGAGGQAPTEQGAAADAAGPEDSAEHGAPTGARVPTPDPEDSAATDHPNVDSWQPGPGPSSNPSADGGGALGGSDVAAGVPGGDHASRGRAPPDEL